MATTQIRPLQSTTSSSLSRPEVQALTLMANGASQKAAAQEMGISQRTYRRLLTGACSPTPPPNSAPTAPSTLCAWLSPSV